MRLWPGGGGGGLFLDSMELLLAGIWEPGEREEDDNDGRARKRVNKHKQKLKKTKSKHDAMRSWAIAMTDIFYCSDKYKEENEGGKRTE